LKIIVSFLERGYLWAFRLTQDTSVKMKNEKHLPPRLMLQIKNIQIILFPLPCISNQPMPLFSKPSTCSFGKVRKKTKAKKINCWLGLKRIVLGKKKKSFLWRKIFLRHIVLSIFFPVVSQFFSAPGSFLHSFFLLSPRVKVY
jgi:hypothetical protein